MVQSAVTSTYATSVVGATQGAPQAHQENLDPPKPISDYHGLKLSRLGTGHVVELAFSLEVAHLDYV